MFIINPESIKDLRVYFARPEVAEYILREFGITPLCYMADDNEEVVACFRMTGEFIDILKQMELGLGKE